MFGRKQKVEQEVETQEAVDAYFYVDVRCPNCTRLVAQPIKKGTHIPSKDTPLGPSWSFGHNWYGVPDEYVPCPNCGVSHRITKEKVRGLTLD